MLHFLQIPINGQHLAASLHLPSKSDSKMPIVICCHGLTGTRIGSGYRAVKLGRMLEGMGIACLRFDFRGCGESDGAFQEVTAQSLMADLNSVVSSITGHPDIDDTRIGFYGSSFGAFTAACLADQIRGVKCLVFIAPVADPHDLIRRDMTPEAWAFLRKNGWIDHHGLKLGQDFFETMPHEDGAKKLANCARPTLVFHGTGDQQVPIEHGRVYESSIRGAGVEAKLEAVDSSDHGLRGATLSERIAVQAAEWFARFI